MKKHRCVFIEWEDRDFNDPKAPYGCADHDIDEALDHLRREHGCTVLEEQAGALFEAAFVAIDKLRRIAKIAGSK